VCVQSGGDSHMAAAVGNLLAARGRAGGLLDTPYWRPRTPAAKPIEIGTRIGAYKIVRELKGGGMGIVYQVVRADEVFHRVSALKMVRPEYNSAALWERFRKEREILAKLDHPNIARIVDGGATPEGLPYLVMDFVDGVPIDAFCAQNGLSRSQRLTVFTQVCGAVQYLQDHDVVHADLKPSNILVTNDGVVKILDFGIANVMRSSSQGAGGSTLPLLTPGYASPEQLRGEEIGAESDIYSLGVVLYELLTGTRPYATAGMAATALLRMIESGPAPKPSAAPGDNPVDAELDAIVLRAMHKDADSRYRSGGGLREDIKNYLHQCPVSALDGNAFYRGRKFIQRKLTALSVCTALAALTGLNVWQAAELGRRKRAADLEEKKARVILERAAQTAGRLKPESISGHKAGAPEGVDLSQFRQSQLLEVHNIGEAYRTSFAEAVRLWPGMTASRRNLIDQGQRYLHQAEGFVRGDPALSEQVAMAWLWIAEIEGGPNNANLHDQAGAAKSIREAERVIANSSTPRAQLLLRAVQDTAKAIDKGSP
jgi:eukaryotic-like serine/threonine-protein kinase